MGSEMCIRDSNRNEEEEEEEEEGKQLKCGGGGGKTIEMWRWWYIASLFTKKVECRVDEGSMRGRCGIDVGSMWGRCRVARRSMYLWMEKYIE